MDCRNCGCNQVGGTQTYPCKDKVDALRRDLRRLDRCLLAAAEETPPIPPRPRPCCCCWCCCCCRRGNTGGNQTTWGR